MTALPTESDIGLVLCRRTANDPLRTLVDNAGCQTSKTSHDGIMMKKTNWKVVAELVGIVAIVGSLLFVGIQLRQEQTIAFAEINQSAVESYVSVNAFIAEHAGVLVRSNAGEQLTDEEALIINRIVHSLHIKFRIEAAMRRSLGDSEGMAPRLFAIFLYNNPGAFRVWLELSEDEEEQYSLLSGGSIYVSDFRADVLDALNKLKIAAN